MILTYDNIFRDEQNDNVIATLLRKGWAEALLDVTLSTDTDPRIADGYPVGYPEEYLPLAVGATASQTSMPQNEMRALKEQHADAIVAYNSRPIKHRVGKGTIMDRIEASGKLPQVMAIFASQSAEDQFRWTNNPWFWSTNATLRGLCAHLGLDADALLAPDPYT